MSKLYRFEAMNATGDEIVEVVEADSQDEAQSIIRQRGYFITRIREIEDVDVVPGVFSQDRLPTKNWTKAFRDSLPKITLVEVMVVFAIIGVLAALLIPAINAALAAANRQREAISALSELPNAPSFTTRNGSVKWTGRTVVIEGQEFIVFENDQDRQIEIVKKEKPLTLESR